MNQVRRTSFLLFLAMTLVLPLRGQKLRMSNETHLITYDTVITLTSLPADTIFQKTRLWVIAHAGDLSSEVRFENEPVALAGAFVLIHPSEPDARSRYSCELEFKIEDGAIEVIVDNMISLDANGKQTTTMESAVVKPDGTFRTGPSFVKRNRETQDELDRIVTNFVDFIYGKEGNVYFLKNQSKQFNATPKTTTTNNSSNKMYLRAGFSLLGAGNDSGEGQLLPGFTVAPGIRLMQATNHALTLSIPLTVGWWHDSYAGIDAPLMLDVSLGSAAGNNHSSKVGLIGGVGMAYFYAESHYPFSSYSVWGYRFEGGLTFGREKDSSRNSIIFNYGRATTGDRGYVFGISYQAIMTNDD